MNDQLQTSEENEFNPLLLMDDLIIDVGSDDESTESDDESESDEIYQATNPNPTKKNHFPQNSDQSLPLKSPFWKEIKRFSFAILSINISEDSTGSSSSTLITQMMPLISHNRLLLKQLAP